MGSCICLCAVCVTLKNHLSFLRLEIIIDTQEVISSSGIVMRIRGSR